MFMALLGVGIRIMGWGLLCLLMSREILHKEDTLNNHNYTAYQLYHSERSSGNTPPIPYS